MRVTLLEYLMQLHAVEWDNHVKDTVILAGLCHLGTVQMRRTRTLCLITPSGSRALRQSLH
jgi:hypothetical protein